MSRHGLPAKLSVWGSTLVDPAGRLVGCVELGGTRAYQFVHELAEAYNNVGEERRKTAELEFRLDYEEDEHKTTVRLVKTFLDSLNLPNDAPERIVAYTALTMHLETL